MVKKPRALHIHFAAKFTFQRNYSRKNPCQHRLLVVQFTAHFQSSFQLCGLSWVCRDLWLDGLSSWKVVQHLLEYFLHPRKWCSPGGLFHFHPDIPSLFNKGRELLRMEIIPDQFSKTQWDLNADLCHQEVRGRSATLWDKTVLKPGIDFLVYSIINNIITMTCNIFC